MAGCFGLYDILDLWHQKLSGWEFRGLRGGVQGTLPIFLTSQQLS